ncbi:MAG TPA: hypothetical protein VLJ21_00020 [Candidatus Binatia bacterium]|nr:hypothetical protein [Candidatus Binatia bacterium]
MPGLELVEDSQHFYAKGDAIVVDVRKPTGTVILHFGGSGVIPGEYVKKFTIDPGALPALVLEWERMGELERTVIGEIKNSEQAWLWVKGVNRLYEP